MTPTVPLKRVAQISVSNVDKKADEEEISVRLCNYVDVYYNDKIVDSLEFMVATATPKQIKTFGLRQGDVIFTKDSETPDDIAVPALVTENLPGVVCGYHLAIARPTKDVTDGRYLYWALAAQPTRDQFAVSATGVTRYGLRQDEIGRVEIPLPKLPEQRVIADYLDGETARIDALIAKKQRMVELLEQRLRVELVRLVLGDCEEARQSGSVSGMYPSIPLDWKETALRHLRCSVQTGPFGSQLHAEEYVEGGWPVVNPMNLVDGSIVAVDTMTISNEKRQELQRHVLRPGDIVFGRRGEMGRAGLVTREHDGWLCGTGSLRLRLDRSSLVPEYLLLLLGTAPARAYFELASVGSTMDNLNSAIVLAFPCLLPPKEVQISIVHEVQRDTNLVSTALGCLARQIDLLQERRQALITEAVTGQLDIPEVVHGNH